MKDKIKAIQLVRHTNPATPEVIEEAVKLGMIPKKDLISGEYYLGSCRNARVAKWDGVDGVFYHLRTKFRSTFCESINHPEDDEGYDVFVPVTLLDTKIED